MSTRCVKFTSKQQTQSYQRNSNHGNQHSSKPMNNIVPKNNKNNNTIQQPKKPQKLQATQPKRRHQKKIIQVEIEVEVEEEEESIDERVYAGPTFSNAPAPSALPIPAFNARGSPINYHPPFSPSIQHQSMYLMNLITPPKVVTAFELEQTNMALSEIQKGLRSMLKIES